MLEELEEFQRADTVLDQADAMIDLLYFALGTLVEMGVHPSRLFDIVHDANMNKTWPDGKVHYSNDGKVIKHDSWINPERELQQEINRQSVMSETKRAGNCRNESGGSTQAGS